MFSFTSGQAHAKRKRIFASAYSKTSVSQGRVQSIIKTRISKLSRFIESQARCRQASLRGSNVVVVRHVFRALQADIFTAFAFSDANGTTFLHNLRQGANTMEEIGMSALDLFHDEKRDQFFFWESEKPFKHFTRLIGRYGRNQHLKAEIWVSQLIAGHEAGLSPGKPDETSNESTDSSKAGLYEKLWLHRHPETRRPLDWAERASEVMDHAVAGQDAVPAALEFMIRQISIHSDVQIKLRHELLTTVPRNAESQSFAMVDSLPYLNAVVMECLRLVDTISSYQTRVVPRGGCSISGHFLPAGTIVAAQPYIINRQPHTFPSPDVFDPSRWLLARDEYRELAKCMWTYSSGPRSCIGRELSLAVMKAVLVEIYMRYGTTLVDPERTTKRPWERADFMAEVHFERN